MSTVPPATTSNPKVDAPPFSSASRLTEGSLLKRNTAWNLLGQVLPLAVGVFAIPVIIGHLGTERFGLLTLVWMVVGYFSLFDFGLGRALTSLVAQKIGEAKEHELPGLISTAKILMISFSVVGGALFALTASWLVRSVLKIPPSLQPEAIHSCYLLGFSLPFVLSTAGFRGILEAHQKFAAVNALRVPLGMITYLAPLMVIPYSTSLVPVVVVLTAGRCLAWLAHLIVCRPFLPSFRRGFLFDRAAVPQLMGFGGWLTVSNIVGPLMVTLDRLVIGAFVSLGAVAYYATPYELVTKAFILPVAITGVLFPAFSTALASDRNRAPRLFDRGCDLVLAGLFPVMLLLIAFAGEGLSFWLGKEFASHSATVLRWLAAGVFINSAALVPYSLIQGAGRADLTAKTHLAELLVYMAGLWWLVTHWGIQGAAIAWTVRVALDALIMFLLASRFLPDGIIHCRQALNKILVSAVAFAAVWLSPLPLRVWVTVGIFSLFLWYVWIVSRRSTRLQKAAAALLRTGD